jgi:hypothetical protein
MLHAPETRYGQLVSDAWSGIVGAAVGGIIGVLGTFLSPYLSSRAKQRDDRRSESVGAARAAHLVALKLEDDFEQRALLRQTDEDHPLQNDPDYHAVRRDFGAQVSLVNDTALRRRLSELNYLLSDLSLERDKVSPFTYGRRIAEHASELLSTYLRGDSPPATPDDIKLWLRHIQWRDEMYEEQRQEVLAMREEEQSRAQADETPPPF